MTLPQLNALVSVERRLMGMEEAQPAPREGDMPPLPRGTVVKGAAEFMAAFGGG